MIIFISGHDSEVRNDAKNTTLVHPTNDTFRISDDNEVDSEAKENIRVQQQLNLATDDLMGENNHFTLPHHNNNNNNNNNNNKHSHKVSDDDKYSADVYKHLRAVPNNKMKNLVYQHNIESRLPNTLPTALMSNGGVPTLPQPLPAFPEPLHEPLAGPLNEPSDVSSVDQNRRLVHRQPINDFVHRQRHGKTARLKDDDAEDAVLDPSPDQDSQPDQDSSPDDDDRQPIGSSLAKLTHEMNTYARVPSRHANNENRIIKMLQTIIHKLSEKAPPPRKPLYHHRSPLNVADNEDEDEDSVRGKEVLASQHRNFYQPSENTFIKQYPDPNEELVENGFTKPPSVVMKGALRSGLRMKYPSLSEEEAVNLQAEKNLARSPSYFYKTYSNQDGLRRVNMDDVVSFRQKDQLPQEMADKQPQLDANPGFQPQSDANAGFQPQPDANAGFQPQPDANPGFQPQSDANPGFQPQPDANPGFQHQPDANSGVIYRQTALRPDAISNQEMLANSESDMTQRPVFLGGPPSVEG